MASPVFAKLHSKYWRNSNSRELPSANIDQLKKVTPETADDAARRHQGEWNAQSQMMLPKKGP
jgi:hypothetical protein